ncbi:hypothetical protein DOTSEDRAFT_34994 [Dothistroma septosporum NZE10]|uniref:Uncharacterized protein n=1 Tax=Dothistroma septosporum (strain NZE10 / CBS 128990) TaxID=675120 RepID=N1PM80_DOTSN|nr:hypothetical protein DOTSEDRAFT_34994 [Dothistroma septosporum NZE10]
MTVKHTNHSVEKTPISRILTKAHTLLKVVKSPNSSTTCKGVCHFLQIPKEVWTKIYGLVLADCNQVSQLPLLRVAPRADVCYEQSIPSPLLLATCHMIRKELDTLYLEHLKRINDEWAANFGAVTEQMHRLDAMGRLEEAGGTLFSGGDDDEGE